MKMGKCEKIKFCVNEVVKKIEPKKIEKMKKRKNSMVCFFELKERKKKHAIEKMKMGKKWKSEKKKSEKQRRMHKKKVCVLSTKKTCDRKIKKKQKIEKKKSLKKVKKVKFREKRENEKKKKREKKKNPMVCFFRIYYQVKKE